MCGKFQPPANGASQGNYFQAKIPKMAFFKAKTGLQKLQRHPNVQTFLKCVIQLLNEGKNGLTETAAAPKRANSIFPVLR